jgi:hypothetical protein
MVQRDFSRSGNSGSTSLRWSDRLIPLTTFALVCLGVVAIDPAKFGASNNASDAAAPKNGIVLNFKGHEVTNVTKQGNKFVLWSCKPNASVSNCNVSEPVSDPHGEFRVRVPGMTDAVKLSEAISIFAGQQGSQK